MLEPVTHPVLIFAIAMLIFFIAPVIMTWMKIPGLIGLIFAGVIIGPNGLSLLERDPTIVLLGTVGLLYIIFIAGLEIDLDGFKKYRQRSIVFGLFSFWIPCIFGIGIGLFLDYSIAGAILLGSLLGSHTLLAYPIASRLGVAKNKAVTTTVGGTIITDTSSLLILAIIAASMQGELTVQFWFSMLGLLLIYVAASLYFIPLVAQFFFRSISSEGSLEFTFVMLILFVTAYCATLVGLEPIIGAFMAGLALNRYVLEHSPLMNRIKFVGNALFIPFFLLSVGMLMDVRVLISDSSAWVVAMAIVIFVQVGKYLAAWISGKLYHYSDEEVRLMFGLSVPQAAATLAATLVGFDLGLFNLATVNAVIVMILITCIVGPYMVEKYGRKVSLLEAQAPYEPSEAPDRILVPLANPKTMESLLELSFAVRGHSSEPLFLLTVAQSYGGSSAAMVADGEKLLNQAITYSSGGNVPTHPLTRVDTNIASGIVRAIEEQRITKVVIGWNGKLSTPQRIFGSVLDQLLEHTSEMIYVTRLTGPINTTKRVVCLIPPGTDHESGYFETVKSMKQITSRLGAELVLYIVKDKIGSYKKAFSEMKPDVKLSIHSLSSWKEAFWQVIHQDDLLTVISARRGSIAWHPQLERMPRILAKNDKNSFIMIYPPEIEPIDLRGARGTDVPRTVMFSREYDE
ncbi:MAG TPA: universal stress protein [Bacilli bacterium]|nr:universal stress protein [Bacilli bacterium]